MQRPIGMQDGKFPDNILRSLGQADACFQFMPFRFVARSLTAPRASVCPYFSALDTKDRTVIVQEHGTFDMFSPKTGMGTLAGTALTEKKHSPVIVHDTTAMNRNRTIGQNHQAESDPQCKTIEADRPVAGKICLGFSVAAPHEERFFFRRRKRKQISSGMTAEGRGNIFITENMLYVGHLRRHQPLFERKDRHPGSHLKRSEPVYQPYRITDMLPGHRETMPGDFVQLSHHSITPHSFMDSTHVCAPVRAFS